MKKTIFAKIALAIALVAISLSTVNAGGRKVETFGIIPKRIGGEWLQKDPKAAYTYMAELGYKQIERNDNYGMTAKECRKMLDDLNLQTIVWGLANPDIEAFVKGNTKGIDKAIRECKAAGAEYLVSYIILPKYKTSIQGWKDWAGVLNKLGEYVNSKGLKLLYHNHAIEFTPIDGQIPYDVLVPALDPKFCNLQLDVYWAIKGGADPLKVMKKYPGRFVALHMKDMAPGADMNFEDLGYGIIDYKPIFKAAPKAGVKYFIVEHDKPTNSKRSVERGAEFFKKFKY